MNLPKLLAGLAIASLALAACGTTGGGSTNKGTIKIGVDLPESGAEASDGIPTLNGVKYAAQTQTTVEGFTIQVSNLDDAVSGVHDPQKGAQNMQQFVSDSTAMADYAVDVLKVTKLGVASDNEVYGKGIADTFSAEFKNKGGTVVKRSDFDTKSTNDFRGFLQSSKSLGAQGIYFGGTDSNKGCVIRSQASGIFTTDTPYMGGDGLQTSQCLKDAGTMATGIYAAVAAPNAEQIPESASIISGFKKAFPNKDDFGAYTMPAYDCAKILIAAIGRAIKANGGNMPTREAVRAEVAKTSDFVGALGNTSFDANGDTSQKIISIYQATGTPVDWVWVKQINYAK